MSDKDTRERLLQTMAHLFVVDKMEERMEILASHASWLASKQINECKVCPEDKPVSCPACKLALQILRAERRFVKAWAKGGYCCPLCKNSINRPGLCDECCEQLEVKE